MKRTVIVLAALLALATAGLATAWAQETYPTGSSGSSPATPTDQQASTPAQQQAGTQPAATSDQAPTTTPDPTITSEGKMPKTASPLPLVGLGGLTTLAMGLWASRPRRRA